MSTDVGAGWRCVLGVGDVFAHHQEYIIVTTVSPRDRNPNISIAQRGSALKKNASRRLGDWAPKHWFLVAVY